MDYSERHDVFDSVRAGKNTLRIVTKFDTIAKFNFNNIAIITRQNRYDLYEKALTTLQSERQYFSTHHIHYSEPSENSFSSDNGSVRVNFIRQFLCTALIDKLNPINEIFTTDLEGVRSFKDEYKNALSKLDMLGLDEIWGYILKSCEILNRIEYFDEERNGNNVNRHKTSYTIMNEKLNFYYSKFDRQNWKWWNSEQLEDAVSLILSDLITKFKAYQKAKYLLFLNHKDFWILFSKFEQFGDEIGGRKFSFSHYQVTKKRENSNGSFKDLICFCRAEFC
jgi:hypothetical protein